MTGALEAAVTLGVFVWALDIATVGEARSLAFSTLVFASCSARSRRGARPAVLGGRRLDNLRLLAVVVVSALVQLAIHQIPGDAGVPIEDLSFETPTLPVGLALIPVTVHELRKLLRRRA